MSDSVGRTPLSLRLVRRRGLVGLRGERVKRGRRDVRGKEKEPVTDEPRQAPRGGRSCRTVSRRPRVTRPCRAVGAQSRAPVVGRRGRCDKSGAAGAASRNHSQETARKLQAAKENFVSASRETTEPSSAFNARVTASRWGELRRAPPPIAGRTTSRAASAPCNSGEGRRGGMSASPGWFGCRGAAHPTRRAVA